MLRLCNELGLACPRGSHDRACVARVTIRCECSGDDSVTAKLTTSLSLSTSETHTDGDTQTWTESAPLIVPAQASTYSALAVNMATYNQNWVGKVRINGMVAVWFDDRIAYTATATITICGSSRSSRC